MKFYLMSQVVVTVKSCNCGPFRLQTNWLIVFYVMYIGKNEYTFQINFYVKWGGTEKYYIAKRIRCQHTIPHNIPINHFCKHFWGFLQICWKNVDMCCYVTPNYWTAWQQCRDTPFALFSPSNNLQLSITWFASCILLLSHRGFRLVLFGWQTMLWLTHTGSEAQSHAWCMWCIVIQLSSRAKKE